MSDNLELSIPAIDAKHDEFLELLSEIKSCQNDQFLPLFKEMPLCLESLILTSMLMISSNAILSI